MDHTELRLDGNSVAGLLAEIFQAEMTTAETTCAQCGSIGMVGAQLVYASAMGVVMRCAGCENALIRLARGRGCTWLDLRGISCLQIAESD